MTHVLVVAAGGAVGSVLRYTLGRVFAGSADSFPWGTLLINAIGCGLLGLFFGMIQSRPPSQSLQTFISVGLLGGFTTFSLFGYETMSLWQSGRVASAVGYIGAAIAAGLGAVWSGYRLGILT